MKPPVQRIAVGTGVHSAEWLVSTRAGQALLAASHGTDHRPRCMCQLGGIEMYVGRRGHVYYLARMLGTGFLHAERCESVEDGKLFSGAFAYAPGAIIEEPNGILSLSANLGRMDRQPPPPTAVSIDGVLDFLVEQADINRVNAGDEPNSWASVRDRMMEAATFIKLGGANLASHLYLPERYSRERGAEILAECESLLKTGGEYTLICAPLKEIRATTYGWQVVLKHLPGLRLWASKEAAQAMERRLRTSCFNNPPTYALCLVAAKPGQREGNYSINNMACLTTNSRFLPCRTERQAEVADSLIKDGRSTLLRPLRFDCAPVLALADFAILGDDTPEPIFVLSPSGDDDLDAAKRSMANLMQRNRAKVMVFD